MQMLLGFQVSLIHMIAARCLDAVCRSPNETTLLYACVLEAQETADRFVAAAALQKVLEKCEHQAPEGVHLPALLRLVHSHGDRRISSD